jgi:hypothetical protein
VHEPEGSEKDGEHEPEGIEKGDEHEPEGSEKGGEHKPEGSEKGGEHEPEDDHELEDDQDLEDDQELEDEHGRTKKKRIITKKESISISLVQHVLERTEDKKLKLRLFFMLVITKYLLRGASTMVNEQAVMYTKDMELFSQIVWSTVVYEDLRDSVKKFKAWTTSVLSGCCIIPMV